jgi:hypothetical protein
MHCPEAREDMEKSQRKKKKKKKKKVTMGFAQTMSDL